MVCPVLLSLDQFLHFPPSQIGSVGLQLGTLFNEGIPLAPMVLIPHETLLRLARETHLLDSIQQINSWYQPEDSISKHKLKNFLREKITTTKLPEWFTHEVISAYNIELRHSFVKLIPAEHISGYEKTNFQHVHSEANVLESFLEIWAHLVGTKIARGGHFQSSWLTPTPIILQAQFQPVVSGHGFTHTGSQVAKHQVLLQAIWGAPDTQLLTDAADNFTVDVRTWHLVHKELATKTKQYERTSDGQLSKPVADKYQTFSTLTEEQVAAIAQVIFAIKQKRMEHQQVSWELTKEGLFVTNVTEMAEYVSETAVIKKTLTKLYISTGNPQKHATPIYKDIDGIGVLRSEYTLAKFGTHPLHVIRSKQKNLLLKELVNTIHAYQAVLPFKPIIYRTQNFTSSELRHLHYAENYEPQEANPYLGFRGGFQLVRQPELLRFELEVMVEVLKNSKGSLGYMLSFIRTASELEQIVYEIEKIGLFTHQNFSVWLQLNTPENILNLRSYPIHKLAGVSLNVKSLQSLLLGTDPDNPELAEHYSLETTGLLKLMEQLATTVTELQELRGLSKPLQLHLHLEDFSHEVVAQAVKLGYHGVVVKPAAVQIARSCIAETERIKLTLDS